MALALAARQLRIRIRATDTVCIVHVIGRASSLHMAEWPITRAIVQEAIETGQLTKAGEIALDIGGRIAHYSFPLP